MIEWGEEFGIWGNTWITWIEMDIHGNEHGWTCMYLDTEDTTRRYLLLVDTARLVGMLGTQAEVPRQ